MDIRLANRKKLSEEYEKLITLAAAYLPLDTEGFPRIAGSIRTLKAIPRDIYTFLLDPEFGTFSAEDFFDAAADLVAPEVDTEMDENTSLVNNAFLAAPIAIREQVALLLAVIRSVYDAAKDDFSYMSRERCSVGLVH